MFYWKQRRDEKQYGVEGQKATKYYMWKDFAKFQMFGDKKAGPSSSSHYTAFRAQLKAFTLTEGKA